MKADVTKDGETWKLADGTIIRRATKRLGLIIHRQRYRYQGQNRYSRGFYLEKMVRGRVVNFPLGTDAQDAAKRADEIGAFLAIPSNTVDEARKIYDPRGVARASKFATLKEVFDAHTAGARTLGISATSAQGYQYALVTILRYVDARQRGKDRPQQSGKRLDRTPWLKRSTEDLTAKLLLDFKATMLDGLEDEEEVLTAQISCDSFMRQARSVFSVDARRYYRHLGLPLPDLMQWFEVPLFNARKYFELPPAAAVERVFADLPALRVADVNVWRAFMLCCHIGLRKSEAAAARWAWLDGTVMKLREDGEFRPKHGHGRRVEVEPWVIAALQAEQVSINTILAGDTATERNELVFGRLNDWLQARGIAARKPTHELRKLWFSYTAKAKGLLAAQQQGGHRDPKVTSQCYADNMMPDELMKHWREA